MTTRWVAAQARARSGGQASPATTIVAPGGTPSGTGRSASAAGGRVRCVMRSVCRNSDSAVPSRRESGTTTTSAPAPSAITSSHTEVSNPAEANCATRCPGPVPSAAFSVSDSATSPVCPTTTLFGVPVEPDVVIRYAAPAGSTGRAAVTGCAAIRRAVCGSDGRSTGSASGIPDGTDSPASSSTGPMSATVAATRAAGSPGSSGR
ncbi:hypothetical protein PSA01_22310 [Pseudonocardia saturnea]|uniref:Uncharacterized protein n=1 Tax=Pseudonocardia saturnea TaxID=33909 RepID=A0ABQ0RX11_9PSEU|nr:hypothetical protein PSA01_22310 [Pseudonocardia saturnea]